MRLFLAAAVVLGLAAEAAAGCRLFRRGNRSCGTTGGGCSPAGWRSAARPRPVAFPPAQMFPPIPPQFYPLPTTPDETVYHPAVRPQQVILGSCPNGRCPNPRK